MRFAYACVDIYMKGVCKLLTLRRIKVIYCISFDSSVNMKQFVCVYFVLD